MVENGEPLIVDDPREDPRFYSDIDAKTGFETRNLLAVPMRTKERVDRRDRGDQQARAAASTSAIAKLASALANQAAIAIDNARLYARLADAVVTSRLSYRF